MKKVHAKLHLYKLAPEYQYKYTIQCTAQFPNIVPHFVFQYALSNLIIYSQFILGLFTVYNS